MKDEEVYPVIKSVAKNKLSNPLLWSWYRSNWKKVHARFQSGGTGLTSPIRLIHQAITEALASESELLELNEFLEVPELETLTQKSVIECKSNILWLQNHQKEIVDWLRTKNATPRL